MKNLYYTFSENNKRDNSNTNDDAENDDWNEIYISTKLKFNNFIDSLAITAMIFEFDKDYEPIERMILIIERINASKGVDKCRIKSGRSL